MMQHPNILRAMLAGDPALVKAAQAIRAMLPEGKPVPLSVQVLEAPATFNRATRRSVGLLGKFWKWDVNTPGLQRTFTPRYVRRHFSAAVPTTRRQRKAQARVLRITAAKGLV